MQGSGLVLRAEEFPSGCWKMSKTTAPAATTTTMTIADVANGTVTATVKWTVCYEGSRLGRRTPKQKKAEFRRAHQGGNLVPYLPHEDLCQEQGQTHTEWWPHLSTCPTSHH